MKIKVAIVDAFVDERFDGNGGGNPAGVVLDADMLSDQQKHTIAKKVGLSETAFVSSSETAGFKLDFYTPQKQIAHCGHATIAAFSHLSQLGLAPDQHTSKETIDGNRAIEVQGDFAYMAQTSPKYGDVVLDADAVYRSVGVSENFSETRVIAPPAIVNTGNSFLIFGVKTIEDLECLVPDDKMIEVISEEHDLIGFYVFSLETQHGERDASTRMFAPRYGIKEESATGMAAGPLACFLHDRMNFDKGQFLIEQGYAMQPVSPSCINVVLSRNSQTIQGVKTGGVGRPSRYIEIEI